MDLGKSARIPETSLIAHAPGWTLFRNLYMSNGTLLVVASDAEQNGFPQVRMMTSTGLIALTTPENIRLREPTEQEMQIITPKEAFARWGGSSSTDERNRVWTVEGNTLLVNEPPQFLTHYYHFVAELLLGTWAFFYGAFNPSAGFVDAQESFGRTDPSVPSFNIRTNGYRPPPLSRLIFLHAPSEGWRDKPGFNSYFLRAAFPSLDIEVSHDWADRTNITRISPLNVHDSLDTEKAWHFPIALLSDRSAAFRGDTCGSQTQRIAAEAWEYMFEKGGLDPFGGWWKEIREAVFRFAGAKVGGSEEASHQPPSISRNVTDPQSLLPLPEQVTITYISRQGVRRYLVSEDHNNLVVALRDLIKKKAKEGKRWNLNIVKPELLSKDEQVKLASETTILLGVHGNGLTHLVLMKPNRYSSVIEIFYPGGFARDYEWTSRSLGMRHYSVWNDT
ncbi:unnamed protein product [Cyclocybe aegerita]|uniref:Glycosyltransferase 61 catalytic domain-containing protein n=1 Tax=Cyclocybe aegerita TaxID=1973307 RepID=A0A8S0VT02_CYCAE|nr:unnamed protein product [Cyclocybe aegerita]